LKEERNKGNLEVLLPALLLPAVEKVFEARTRLDRKVALLRCVEAVRLYAAAHDGKPPAALADIKEVPVPADPLTGKPFDYKADGDQATLTARPPAGQQPNPGNMIVYQLTIKR